MIVLILTAFGLILGNAKPADALRRIGGILGVVILILVLPAVVVSIWSGISLWLRLGLAILCVLIGLLRRPRKRKSCGKEY
jgi:apolipoprotein N-acyltransferase